LQLPTREATVVGLQKSADTIFRVVSGDADENARMPDVEVHVSDLVEDGKAISYEAARALFGPDPGSHWAGYVLGIYVVLMREKGLILDSGARILVSSDVPEAKGVSSSAALEVATMMAICSAYDVTVEPREMAFLS